MKKSLTEIDEKSDLDQKTKVAKKVTAIVKNASINKKCDRGLQKVDYQSKECYHQKVTPRSFKIAPLSFILKVHRDHKKSTQSKSITTILTFKKSP